MTVTQIVIKFLNTNYIFLGILGRPGHDPYWVMTQIFGLGHDHDPSTTLVLKCHFNSITILKKFYLKK